MNRFTIVLIISILFLFYSKYSLATEISDVKQQYENGVKEYDVLQLNKALSTLQINNLPDVESYLLQGKILQRLCFIYYIKGEKNSSEEFGRKAIRKLNDALKINPANFEAIAYRGIVSQTLSNIGWGNDASYGPKAKNDLDTLKKTDPNHYLTRLMDAIAYLETPSLFGGDKNKAFALFLSLCDDYPDEEDAQVYLASSYIKLKKDPEANTVVEAVLIKNPMNIFAKQLKQQLDNK